MSLLYYAFNELRIDKEMESFLKIKNYLRRIYIVAQIDIMELLIDVKNILINKDIPNELGYIGVINRDQNAVRNKLSKEEKLKKEKDFFNSEKIYMNLPKELLGYDSLIKKISKVYFKLIKDNISEEIKKDGGFRENIYFFDNNSLKDDEISKIIPQQPVIKKEESKKQDIKEESKIASSGKPENKKAHGNLFG